MLELIIHTSLRPHLTTQSVATEPGEHKLQEPTCILPLPPLCSVLYVCILKAHFALLVWYLITWHISPFVCRNSCPTIWYTWLNNLWKQYILGISGFSRRNPPTETKNLMHNFIDYHIRPTLTFLSRCRLPIGFFWLIDL